MRPTDGAVTDSKPAESFKTAASHVDLRKDVLNRLRSWRHNLLWQRSLHFVALSTVTFAVFRLMGWFDQDHAAVFFAGALGALLVLMFALLLFSDKWKALTPDNFVLHLNRRFPDFEESAQLLLRDHHTLPVLQQLQQQRSMKVYAGNLAKVEAWRPELHFRGTVLVVLLFGLIALMAPQIRDLATQIASWRAPDPISVPDTTPGGPGFSNISVRVTPPNYTDNAASESSSLDLDVFEGSLIQWSLDFTEPADSFAIEFSDGRQLPMQPDAGTWQFGHLATGTDLYKIAAINAGESSYIGDIYTLSVQLDQAPDIKIVEPTVTTLEIPKSGPAEFNSEVLVSDDYEINSVEIVASVAKGSGEGVKFRDQTLDFDQSIKTEKGQLYQRHWDLASLDMEPGDEIYFSVVATDNKLPEANTSRSTTLIIRWLEDENAGIAADGLAIDFIPEFFKSQRQIIIDTEQLIEDKPNLEIQDFKDTSYEIGQAQADLKQKYGQFLGDEFGEGPGEQLGFAGSASTTDHADDHERGEQDQNATGHNEQSQNEQNRNEQRQAHSEAPTNPSGGHAHVESGVTINNATNIGDIVKLFGHDHGDPEIGKVSKQSPIALMKRAVSEMWLAERHLMQAEAELALPYEYEAYKYLKLARQADRIYVKRLGFEPPPVSEENRLTGDLEEIRSYSLQQHSEPDNLPPLRAEQRLLRQVWQLLNAHRPEDQITSHEDEILANMSEQYRTLSQQRPALIKQAASIEKLRAGKQWRLVNCGDCFAELKQSIWNLMDDGDAWLRHPRSRYDSEDQLIKSYQSELQTRSGNHTPADRSAQSQDGERP